MNTTHHLSHIEREVELYRAPFLALLSEAMRDMPSARPVITFECIRFEHPCAPLGHGFCPLTFIHFHRGGTPTPNSDAISAGMAVGLRPAFSRVVMEAADNSFGREHATSLRIDMLRLGAPRWGVVEPAPVVGL